MMDDGEPHTLTYAEGEARAAAYEYLDSLAARIQHTADVQGVSVASLYEAHRQEMRQMCEDALGGAA